MAFGGQLRPRGEPLWQSPPVPSASQENPENLPKPRHARSGSGIVVWGAVELETGKRVMNSQEYLNQLVENTHWIRGVARRMLSDEHLVDDIVQQTYITALNNQEREIRNFRAWVYTVVRNFVRMAMRDRQRRRNWEAGAAKAEEVFPSVDPCEADEIRGRLIEQVLELKEPYRSTLVQYYYEDLNSNEIAAREGVPPNTVRVRMRRAITQLRERIERRYNGESKEWRFGLVAVAGLTLPELIEKAGATATVGAASATADPSLPTTDLQNENTQASAASAPAGVGRFGAVAALVVLSGLLVWWLWPPTNKLSGEDGSGADVASSAATSMESASPVPTARQVAGGAAPESPSGGVANSSALDLPHAWLQVLDAATGDPVRGASVSFESYAMRSERLARGRNAAEILALPFCDGPAQLTDATGRITVTAESLAGSELAVRAPGYQEHRERTRRRGVSEASTYTVSLVPAVSAHVFVEHPDDGPLAGIEVELLGTSGDRVLAETDARGSLSFTWQDQDYLVRVRAPGFAGYQDLARAPRTKIVLVAGLECRGSVVDSRGEPVASASVSMVSPQWRGTPFVTETDSRGEFELPAAKPGHELQLSISHPNFPLLLQKYPVREEPFEIRLTPGVSVTGRVVDPFGKAAPSGRVQLVPVGPPIVARDLARTEIGDDGRFVLGPVPAGSYVAQLLHPEFVAPDIEIEVEASQTPEALVFRLQRGAVVQGTVVDPSGAGVPGVRLQVGAINGDELWGPVTVTDSQGKFEFAAVPLAEPEARVAVRDFRWSALHDSQGRVAPRGLLLEVMRPDELLRKDSEEIVRYGIAGSRNTCRVQPDETNIELVVAPREGQPRIVTRLRNTEGKPVRTINNWLVVPDTADPVADAALLFAGTHGVPVNTNDLSVLDGALIGILSRTHTVHFAAFPGTPEEVQIDAVIDERAPRSFDLLGSDHQPLAGRSVFVLPQVDGPVPPVAVFVGKSDDQGVLALDFLGSGSYQWGVAKHEDSFRKARPLMALARLDEIELQGQWVVTAERPASKRRESADRNRGR